MIARTSNRRQLMDKISKSKTPEQMRSGRGQHVGASSAAPKGTMSSSGTPGAKNAMSHGEREAHAKGVMGHNSGDDSDNHSGY